MCVRVCMYMCMYVCVFVCMCTQMCVHVETRGQPQELFLSSCPTLFDLVWFGSIWFDLV